MSQEQPPRSKPYLRVFISYSHDSKDHARRVLELANRLRRDGVDAQIDQFIMPPEEGWPSWMDRHIREDDFVLMVCTEIYLRRVQKKEQIDTGLGVQWEGHLIYNHIYAAGTRNDRFIPIYFGKDDKKYVPDLMKAWNNYEVGTEDGYKKLLAHLAGAHAEPAPLGAPLQENPAKWQDRPREVDHHNLGGILKSGADKLPRNPSPAHLLVARHEVVSFKGRVRELDDLDRWADDEKTRTAGRLIHAPGGMGKTRLAIEWTRRLREKGWDAGFISGDITDEIIAAIMNARRPVAAVVDYAEVRPGLGKLLDALARARETGDGPHRARVLLLARNAGDWWLALCQRSTEVDSFLCDSPEPVPLAAMYEEVPDRAREFERAAQAFAQQLQKKAGVPSPDLNDPIYDRLLYVHIAAMIAVIEGPAKSDQLLDKVLEHEARFWLRDAGLYEKEAREAPPLRRMVETALAAVTLRGGAKDESELKGVIARVTPGADQAGLCRLLEDVYRDQSNQAFITPLEPDLLGEHLVYKVLTDPHTPQPFLEPAIANASEKSLTHAFIVLGRIELKHPDQGRAWLRELLKPNLTARALPAFNAALALATETAHSLLGMVLAKELEFHDNQDIARDIDGRIPHETVSLRELAVVVGRTMLNGLSPKDTLSNERARRLNDLGNRLSQIGQFEEALTAMKEAMRIYRVLAKDQPDGVLPQIAMCLNNLGNIFRYLGQREEALAAAEETVKIGRALAKVWPDRFLPDLAMSLNNLGSILHDLNLLERALAATEEAVDIYRALANAKPKAFLPGLAMSLNNLGTILGELDRRKDAVAASEEAVQIGRALVKDLPDAFLPDLAESLSNLGIWLIRFGQQKEALAVIKEAVALRRALAKNRPEAFLPDLALSLHNLGTMLTELGRREEALGATEEAVEIRRALAKARPDAFIPNLTISLGLLGMIHLQLGAVDKARTTHKEALDFLWPLFKKLPLTFAELAMKLLLSYSLTFKGDPPAEAMELMGRYGKVLEGLEKGDSGSGG